MTFQNMKDLMTTGQVPPNVMAQWLQNEMFTAWLAKQNLRKH
jgi:hypothetical protein